MADKEAFNNECIRLKEDMNSRQIQIEGLENQIRVNY